MGVILSGPRSKAAYLHDQSIKARRQALKAKQADDPDEAARLEDVAMRAEDASLSAQLQAEESSDK